MPFDASTASSEWFVPVGHVEDKAAGGLGVRLPKVDPGPAGSPQQLSVGAGVQEGEGAPVMHRGAHGAEPRFAHGPWASWGLDCCTCRHTTDRLSGIAEHMHGLRDNFEQHDA